VTFWGTLVANEVQKIQMNLFRGKMAVGEGAKIGNCNCPRVPTWLRAYNGTVISNKTHNEVIPVLVND